LRGLVRDWDVLNEPWSNHTLQDVLGEEAMADWFRAAKAADPEARLFINDFGILNKAGEHKVHQDHYEKTIQFLLEHNAPIDGIGMQAHFGWDLTPPVKLVSILDRFAKLGLPLRVSEFDINIDDEDLQADYLRDFYTAVFSHEAVEAIMMWGFWDGDHWKGNAPIYREDWTLKPSGEAWKNLVFDQWWTREEGKTDEDGVFSIRGFLGNYEITVETQSRKKVETCSLDRAGTRVAVIVSP